MDKELHEKIRNHVCGPMDSTKARGLTNANSNTLAVTCLNSIFKLIDHRAKYGYDTVVWNCETVNNQYDVFVTMSEMSTVRDFLIEEGYKVDIDGSYLRISW